MNALDPHDCSRCRRQVAADDPERPEHVSSTVFAPLRPRPTMPGGVRPDGTVVEPTAVWWEVEADYEQRGTIAAMLCPACIQALTAWLYEPAARIAPSPSVPARAAV